MTNDEILSQVKTPENLRAYVEQITDRRGNQYVCPFCGSGTGPRHTAAFTLYGERFHCYACGEQGDVLDLIGNAEGIEGYTDRLHRAAEIFGIDYDETPRPTKPVKPAKVERKTANDYTIGREREKAYIEECAARIELAADYLQARGWTVDEARSYGMGYDPTRKRLVIPWAGCDYYHIDRDVTGKAAHKYEYPRADEVGPRPIYNPRALGEKAFVVVEGALDAMAVMRCGVRAVVALGGTGYRALVDELEARHFQGGVVVMLDADEPGRKASAGLIKALGDARITATELVPSDGKDADEMYGGDASRVELSESVRKAIAEVAEDAQNADRNPNMRLYDPMEVATRIFMQEDADTPIPTGIKGLDAMIGGGLMRGLYVMGATSSFGKTTIAVQIADHIAATGHPVLFVTIEQSAQEIVAKSLSRLTHDPSKGDWGGLAAQDVTTSTKRAGFGNGENAALVAAMNAYTAEVAPSLRILEGIKRPTVADVRAAADAMAAQFGKSPVIFIDYLQLLASRDERDTDKQAVDYNVTALRIMARDLKTPIWCVATLNRDSYSGPVDLDSFKESGSVEYGCDYAFGLQPQGIAAEVEGVKSAVEKKLKGNAYIAKAKKPENTPRKVELTVLKNRQGMTTGTSDGIQLDYWPRTNLFEEV